MLVVALFHIVFMNYTKGIINNCRSRNFMSQFYLRFVFKMVDETLIVEIAVWPMPFLINVFIALKGYQF